VVRALAVAVVVVLLAERGALANGAFPDSLGILLPADEPETIIAVTNFGLLVSKDDGETFEWVCEEAVGPYAAPYQLGPPPDDLVVAVHYEGLAVSPDFGCTWQAAQGPWQILNDVFPDPTDPRHVLVIGHAAPAEGEPTTGALLESTDGALTFGAPLYFTAPGGYLAGVEISESDPDVAYLAMYGDPPGHAVLLRTEDLAGGQWERVDLTPLLEAPVARIILVHPTNPDLLYLRMQDGAGRDQLAIYDHASGTARIALQLEFLMTAFLRRSDGAVIVSASDGGAFISEDDAQTFEPWEGAPRFRALGERDGVLYAVADNFVDGFAVGRSSDEGETWEPLVRFDGIHGPLSCGDIPVTCAGPWENLKVLFGIGPDGGDAGPGGDGGPGNEPRGGGCGCRAPGSFPSRPPVLLAALFILLRRATRGQARPRAR
jgi:photosystem II stability/assembly factor-like uncharacterized protein